MLKQRILTAALLIPIILIILFLLPISIFGGLVTLIAFAALWEWANLMGLQKKKQRFLYLLISACVFFGALFIPVNIVFIFSLCWWIFAFLLILLYSHGINIWYNNIFCKGVIGFFVILPAWTALNYMRNQSDGAYAILFLFILVWGADSVAYFTGRAWGTHKLAPKVSPGKSWQGVMGAILFACFIATLIQWLFDISPAVWFYGVLISLVTILFSVVGDLFESMMKRQAGVKDSSQLLPGHGGILDRIDSLTAAAPIFTLGAILLGTYLS